MTRDAMLAAEARMRVLIAYGREFTRPARTGSRPRDRLWRPHEAGRLA
jgi:hypothetical protein